MFIIVVFVAANVTNIIIKIQKHSIKYLLARRIFTQKCMKYDISIFNIILSHTDTHGREYPQDTNVYKMVELSCSDQLCVENYFRSHCGLPNILL